MGIPLADRVLQNYTSVQRSGQPSPIETMSRVYPAMFGSGLEALDGRRESGEGANGEPETVDIGIGSYLPTDSSIAEAVAAGVRSGSLHYLRRPDVNQAVAQKYLDEQGVALDPERQIFLTGGARTAMALVLLRFMEVGDRVVIPDPDYVGLAHVATGYGGEVVRVPMARARNGGLSVDVQRMVETIVSGCRLVMITNPNNPTGQVWTLEALQAVTSAVTKVGAVILANEVYDKLIFDGFQHHSVLAIGDPEHTVVVSGPGKAYDITGVPLGWVAGSEHMVRPLPDVAFMFHVPTPSAPALYAGLAVLSEPLRSQHPLRSVKILQENARSTARVFDEVPGFLFPVVAGGQFAFPWIGVDDIEFCVELKRRAAVTVMPGTAWGQMGRGHVRIALANRPDVHARGLARLQSGLREMSLAHRWQIASPPADIFNYPATRAGD